MVSSVVTVTPAPLFLLVLKGHTGHSLLVAAERRGKGRRWFMSVIFKSETSPWVHIVSAWSPVCSTSLKVARSLGGARRPGSLGFADYVLPRSWTPSLLPGPQPCEELWSTMLIVPCFLYHLGLKSLQTRTITSLAYLESLFLSSILPH